eukprot:Anaeramoba_flamelloidesc37405_g1_i1.p1 GENE.c37405_g1_i1~~c37405_g1_i1.p1  ORF type:complete len:249 (-),score=27.86 c37405_g1_i1:600-1346(-)
MKKNDKSLLIDKFVTGKLEDTELWEFKADIDKDPDLAKEVKLRKEIFDAIKDDEKVAFVKTLQNINRESQSTPKKRSITRWQLQSIAAAIIVLALIGTGIFTGFFSSDKNMNLYSAYFVDEGNLLATRTISGFTKDEVKSGIQFYEDQKYDEALSVFNEMPNNLIARLYSGFTYMKTEEFAKAEQQFNYIIDHGDNIFIDQAEWNIGLSYLAQDEIDKAKMMFTNISKRNSAYRDNATNILKEINDTY